MAKLLTDFFKNVSNFNQYSLSGILKILVSPLWRTSFTDQESNLFADIFINIGS